MSASTGLSSTLVAVAILGGALVFALLFVAANKLVARLSGYRKVVELYPTDEPSPINTGLFSAQLGLLRSLTLHAGSSERGLYLHDPLVSPKPALIPWHELTQAHTMGRVVVFTLSQPRIDVTIARDLAEQSPFWRD